LIVILIVLWLVDWLIDWFYGWLIGCLNDCLNDWLLKVPKSKEEKTLSADEGKALCKEENYICLMFISYIFNVKRYLFTNKCTPVY